MALFMGRKIPAPGRVVVKYETLYRIRIGCSSKRDKKHLGGADLPFYLTGILPPLRELGVQLHASKSALLSLDGTDEANGPEHVAWDFDDIANEEVIPSLTGSGGWHFSIG